VKKFAVMLEVDVVEGLRDEARRMAVRRGRDVTWVDLLREGAALILLNARAESSASAEGAR
jgi:hypothetical protein